MRSRRPADHAGRREAMSQSARAMLRSKRSENTTAAILMAPFVVIYGLLFVYPTVKMAQLSLTDAPLIGAGKWVGLDNYYRLASDRLFRSPSGTPSISSSSRSSPARSWLC